MTHLSRAVSWPMEVSPCRSCTCFINIPNQNMPRVSVLHIPSQGCGGGGTVLVMALGNGQCGLCHLSPILEHGALGYNTPTDWFLTGVSIGDPLCRCSVLCYGGSHSITLEAPTPRIIPKPVPSCYSEKNVKSLLSVGEHSMSYLCLSWHITGPSANMSPNLTSFL